MNNTVKWSISVILLVYFFSCTEKRNKETKLEVIDSKENKIGNVIYTVYSSDTNWIEMEDFADKLLKNRGENSAVGFYQPKDKVPKINDNFSIPGDAVNYMIGVYRYNEEQRKFTLYKNRARVAATP